MGGRLRRVGSAVAAVLAVALVASACGGGGGGQDAETVSIEWSEPENPLVPGNTNEQGGGDVVDMLFTGLVDYAAEDAEPGLAHAAAIDTTDNRVFTIRLKPGWTFHDGTPVTAQSYVDAWNWTANGANGAQNQSFMEKIEGYAAVSGPQPAAPAMSGLQVVDPLTFTVTLSSPFTLFPETLGYTAYYPMPEAFFADPAGYEQNPIGNGHFRFESRTPNQNLFLTRFAEYAGDDPAQVERLEFRVYSDIQAAYDDVVSGNLDHIRQIAGAPLVGDQWRADLGAGAQQKDGLVIDSLGFPLYDPRFQNPALRLAISKAIDRQTITQQIFDGSRVPADSYAAPGAEGYVPGNCGDACVYDPAAAQALLAQAGGFTGPLTLSANADGGHGEWMEAVATNLRQNLGIDAQYTPVPTFNEQRRLANAREFTGMFRSGWQADYPILETFLTPIYGTGGSANDYEYSNPAVDQALAAANAAPTREAADQAYAAAERLIAADVPATPIFTRPVLWGNGPKLASAERNPLNRLDAASITLANPPQG